MTAHGLPSNSVHTLSGHASTRIKFDLKLRYVMMHAVLRVVTPPGPTGVRRVVRGAESRASQSVRAQAQPGKVIYQRRRGSDDHQQLCDIVVEESGNDKAYQQTRQCQDGEGELYM